MEILCLADLAGTQPAENLEEVYSSNRGVDRFTEVNPALGDPSIFQKRKRDSKPAVKPAGAVLLPILDLKDHEHSRRELKPCMPTPTSVPGPSSPLGASVVSKEGPLWKKIRKRASAGILNHWSQRWCVGRDAAHACYSPALVRPV